MVERHGLACIGAAPDPDAGPGASGTSLSATLEGASHSLPLPALDVSFKEHRNAR